MKKSYIYLFFILFLFSSCFAKRTAVYIEDINKQIKCVCANRVTPSDANIGQVVTFEMESHKLLDYEYADDFFEYMKKGGYRTLAFGQQFDSIIVNGVVYRYIGKCKPN